MKFKGFSGDFSFIPLAALMPGFMVYQMEA
jgi:hypothetical protein